MKTPCICFVLLLLAAAGPARAESGPEGGTEQARLAFVEGTSLAKEQRWHEALEAFERSARLRAHPVTSYNIAYCARALGRYTQSWVMFSRALAPGSADELPPDLTRSARVYHREVEDRIARVRVTLPRELTLLVDDRALESVDAERFAAGARATAGTEHLPAGTFELIADPGPHTFVLSLSDGPRTVVRRVLSSGDNGALTLAVARREVPPAAPSAPAQQDRRQQLTAPPAYGWPIVAFGVGTVGLTVGTVFGLRALSEERALDEACPGGACTPEHAERLDDAKRDAMVSNIGFGVGLAGIAVGTYLLVSGRERPTKSATRAWIGVSVLGARATF